MTKITQFGVMLNTLEQNIVEETKRFLKYTGLINVSASSASGEAIAITSEMRTRMEQLVADAISSMTLEGSVGIGLDRLSEIYGYRRKLNEPSVVYVTIKGAVGQRIHIGAEFLTTGKPQYSYYAVKEEQIPASGEVIVQAESVDPDARIHANGVTMPNPIANVTSVENISPSIDGVSRETDAEYRNRISKDIGSPNAVNIIDGLYQALLNIHGVRRVGVFDNRTNATVGVVPAGYFSATVDGGDSKEIASTIRVYEGAGCPSAGNVTEVIHRRGEDITVHFNRPVPIPVSVAVTLVTDSTFNRISNNVIIDDILRYVNSRNIGESLYVQQIEALCFHQGVASVVVKLNGAGANIQVAHDSVVITDISSIVV